MIALQLTRCQCGGGGGGPSTFGYDASSACSKPYSRTKRSHHEDLPCDFGRQNWCTIAGSSYPWYFVHLRFISSDQTLLQTFARPTFVHSRACLICPWRKFWRCQSSNQTNQSGSKVSWVKLKIQRQWLILKFPSPFSAVFKIVILILYKLIYHINKCNKKINSQE